MPLRAVRVVLVLALVLVLVLAMLLIGELQSVHVPQASVAFSATAATQVSGECVKDWTGLTCTSV
jgi:cytochrome c-type biogenesis protein CcmH/NrfG